MAFFGLTQLGYQNPIGDKKIINPRGELLTRDGCSNVPVDMPPSFLKQQGTHRFEETSKALLQHPSYSAQEHHGSHKRYKEMMKQAQNTRPPSQLYITPVTENQQYGWTTSGSPEPWTQIQRFPRKVSAMTKFVNDMSMKDQEFIWF